MTQVVSSQTDALLANAQIYQNRLFRPGAPRKPRTGVAVVTCMDARIDVYALLGLTEGDAHVVRNAGAVVTDDVVRSLTISQRLLNTTEVMVIMHAGCGLRETTDEDFATEIEADVGVRPAWSAQTFRDSTAEAQQGVARLRSSLFLRPTTSVRGFLFDETTGAVREIRCR
jgi:carbonic anhydrase